MPMDGPSETHLPKTAQTPPTLRDRDAAALLLTPCYRAAMCGVLPHNMQWLAHGNAGKSYHLPWIKAS